MAMEQYKGKGKPVKTHPASICFLNAHVLLSQSAAELEKACVLLRPGQSGRKTTLRILSDVKEGTAKLEELCHLGATGGLK